MPITEGTTNPISPVHTPPIAAAAHKGKRRKNRSTRAIHSHQDPGQHPAADPQDDEQNQRQRVPKLRHPSRQAEDRLEPGDRAHDRVADDRSNHPRHQRFHFEVFGVEDLRRDERPGQRRLENCGDARAQSRGQRHVALAGGELEQRPRCSQPVAAPIWAMGPSRPEVRPPPIVSAEVISLKMAVGNRIFCAPVEGPDGRIGAYARRFGRKPPGQKAAQQARSRRSPSAAARAAPCGKCNTPEPPSPPGNGGV